MLEPGTLLEGRYQVERLLGSGSFADVYLALHQGLRSRHAVKILSATLAVDPGIRERFLAEGRIQAQIQHPHLVRVTEILSDPLPALVMDYVEGRTLDEWVSSLGRPVSEREALAILVPVLDAIGTVHASGIVHRDIKPENIIVSRDSTGRLRPVVSDFGIAKVQEGSALAGTKRRTEVGMFIGTPEYMSPEQIRGEGDLDARSDIFALGVLAYELVSGRHPFAGRDGFETQRNIVDGNAPRLGIPVPEAVAGVIHRAMASARGERFPDCAAFRGALEDAFGDQPTQSASGVYRLPESLLPPKPPPVPPPPAPGSVAPPERSAPGDGGSRVLTRVILAVIVGGGLFGVVAAVVGVALVVSQRREPAVAPSPVQSPATPPPTTGRTVADVKTVRIPAGEFMMGAPVGEPGRFKDETLHRVTVTHGFEIGATEVTLAQWTAADDTRRPWGSAGDDEPVFGINWIDAVRFCNTLSRAEGLPETYSIQGATVSLTGARGGWRLPTEAEWEYAMRAGSDSAFAGATGPATVAWFGDTSGGKPHAVATLAPNAWNIHDGSGNVAEWVWDLYGAYPAGQVTDPTGPTTGENRVLRGGSYTDSEAAIRVAYRKAAYPLARDPGWGFRLARDAD